MDISIILTIIGTTAAIIGSNIALISWLRSDMKAFETKIETWTNEFRKDMSSYKDEVNKEMKDFHGRLCSMNERTKPRTDP